MSNSTKKIRQLRKHAVEIFHAGVAAVAPDKAVQKFVQLRDETVQVDKQNYDLRKYRNVFVVGCGKASAAMALPLEQMLGDKITDGAINVKYDHGEKLEHVNVIEAGHPIPDEAGINGAHAIADLLKSATEDDLVFCLISGGGSALLPLPAKGISLNEKQALTDRLLACGAAIDEINTVRKHISKVKGGQLARLASPATVVTLILSDVVGDPLDAIASGPTVPDSTSYADAKKILQHYDLWDDLSSAIAAHLDKGVNGDIPDNPKNGDDIFRKTQNVIVASNILAAKAALNKAEEQGYHSLLLSTLIEGETRDVARVHAAIGKEIRRTGHPLSPPACVISGGETTVTLRGDGKGGRNQEFALAAAIDIAGLANVVILSGGTDGTDGPTDAAGALCDGTTIARAEQAGLNAEKTLANNDSYPFFKQLDDLLITGPTKTNVMDLRLILVDTMEE